MYKAGNSGVIYKEDESVINNVTMHETGHLVGLADRYEDIYNGYIGNGSIPYIHPGYESDLMSDGRKNIQLDVSHYRHYIDMYGKASRSLNTAIGKIQIGRLGNGNLKTPYEKGYVHKRHPLFIKP